MTEFIAPDFWVSTRLSYKNWLYRKATVHFKRDKIRNVIGGAITLSDYLREMHLAVIRCKGLDYYTGEPLSWGLVGLFDNSSAAEAKANGENYKKTFHTLPSIDHAFVDGVVRFEICSWKINDAKNDLNFMDFLELCKCVLEHNGFTVERS